MKTPAKYGAYVESAEYIRRICKWRALPMRRLFWAADWAAMPMSWLTPWSSIRRHSELPTSTVSYQKGELVYGKIAGKTVLAMNGRFHFYEGWEMWECAYPVGVFKVLG